MKTVLALAGLSCVVSITLAQCTFLAATRLGAFFYYPNIICDAAWKKLSLRRELFEIGFFSFGLVVMLLSGWCSVSFALVLALLLAMLRLQVRHSEYKILSEVYVHQDFRRENCCLDQQKPELAGCLPEPTVHPALIVNFKGPFVARYPHYELGDLALGRLITLEVLIANHSLMPCQALIHLSCEYGQVFEPAAAAKNELQPLPSGGFHTTLLQLKAATASGDGAITISIEHGGRSERIKIRYSSIFDAGVTKMTNASISRYAGGARAGFAWRGDMDLYDTATFQSIEGLTNTLSLAARYRFPQTMYLSTRLSLDADEAARFYTHFGVARGHECIGRFKSWINEQVELRHEISYPFSFKKPYALELGNHMHLHYGTDAAAAAENQWRLTAGIGAGVYPWMSGDKSSFAEQRDNALMARSAMEQAFSFTPKSWAMPDSTNDQYTPAAVQAAGCDVTSDADATHKDNVIFQPPPHHPVGTTAVELTKRYPGDPQDFIHYSMILYWLHRAHRKGIPVIFMSHQHLRMYEGHACTRFTEAVMRYVLTRFNGDLHVNTVYGIGRYWRDVFSPKVRTVQVSCRSDLFELRNAGDTDIHNVPVDIRFEGGKTATVLVDLPAGATAAVDIKGTVVLTS